MGFDMRECDDVQGIMWCYTNHILRPLNTIMLLC